MTTGGNPAVTGVIEASVAALLASRGVSGSKKERVAKSVASRCAGLPQFRPPIIRKAPLNVIGRKARERFVEEQAAKFLSEIRIYIDEVVGFLITQIVDVEVERLAGAAEQENEHE